MKVSMTSATLSAGTGLTLTCQVRPSIELPAVAG